MLAYIFDCIYLGWILLVLSVFTNRKMFFLQEKKKRKSQTKIEAWWLMLLAPLYGIYLLLSTFYSFTKTASPTEQINQEQKKRKTKLVYD